MNELPEGYHRTWLSWTTVNPVAASGSERVRPAEATHTPLSIAENTNTESALRSRVQIARIERLWSVMDLGAQVQCDGALIADYERGRGVLDPAVMHRMRRVLSV